MCLLAVAGCSYMLVMVFGLDLLRHESSAAHQKFVQIKAASWHVALTPLAWRNKPYKPLLLPPHSFASVELEGMANIADQKQNCWLVRLAVLRARLQCVGLGALGAWV